MLVCPQECGGGEPTQKWSNLAVFFGASPWASEIRMIRSGRRMAEGVRAPPLHENQIGATNPNADTCHVHAMIVTPHERNHLGDFGPGSSISPLSPPLSFLLSLLSPLLSPLSLLFSLLSSLRSFLLSPLFSPHSRGKGNSDDSSAFRDHDPPDPCDC